jgi:MFS family permease
VTPDRHIPGRSAWVVLFILYGCYACNMADRHVLSILAPEIKRELNLSDGEVGLLTGPAIAFLYAVLGVPLSYLADRVHRVRFLAASLVVWSGFTALGGLAANAWQLAASRIGVSAAEAGGTPASASIIADHFPPLRRAFPMAVFASASTAGIFASFTLGGLIAHHYGWRAALMAAGAPGLLLSLVLLAMVREPSRGILDGPPDGAHDTASRSMLRTIAEILGIAIYRRTLIATAALSFAIATTLAWGPTFVMRKFGINSAEAGSSLGIGIALIGGLCIILAGVAVERVGRSGLARALRMVGLLQASGPIFLLAALTVDNFAVAAICFSLLYGVMHFYVPVYYVVAQNHVPVRMRATTVAIGVLGMTLLGQGLAPPVIGFLSDALRTHYGEASLGFAMAPTGLVTLFSAFMLFRAANLAEEVEG